MSRPTGLLGGLTVPLIGAPMTGVSSPELVVACCRAGILGTLPATNARSTAELAEWLDHIDRELASGGAAPYGINFPRYSSDARNRADLAAVLSSGAELVISSVGSPAALLGPCTETGKAVYSDVATMRHARRSIELGVDGLILLTAGAGGITGWMNPFVFVRAVREIYSGPLVLAGGVADGVALDAALHLGCDAAYLGTALIPAIESGAPLEFREAVLNATLDDVRLTPMPTGLTANAVTVEGEDPLDGVRVFSMGHTAHAVRTAATVQQIVERIEDEFVGARAGALAT